MDFVIGLLRAGVDGSCLDDRLSGAGSVEVDG